MFQVKFFFYNDNLSKELFEINKKKKYIYIYICYVLIQANI